MDDALRAALLGRNARVETIEVELAGVRQTIGVRQATMGAQGRLLSTLQRAAKAEDPTAVNAVKVQFAIECACDATGNPLFNDRDAEGLRAQPSGGWIDRVYDVALRLMRAPAQSACRIEIPADGDKPAHVCGGVLMLSAPKCPWCGGDVPHPVEAAEKNF